MVGSVTPVLGFTDTLSAPLGYWDTGSGIPSPALGTRIMGTDGNEYILAEASGVVAAAGTDVILTVAGPFTFAAGAGQWETTAATIAIGDVTWLRKLLIDAL